MASNPGVVSIHGKEYKTVAGRIAEFRALHPKYTIETELVSADDERVVVKATILDDQVVIATGYAEEVRASSNINKTSALENCETSAVGRALAFFGLAGTEIASADEVAGAISQQNQQAATAKLIAHNLAWRKHESDLSQIKDYLGDGDLHSAWVLWNDLPEEDRVSLRVAATKGGCFSVEQGKLLKKASDEDFDPDTGVYKSIAGKAND